MYQPNNAWVQFCAPASSNNSLQQHQMQDRSYAYHHGNSHGSPHHGSQCLTPQRASPVGICDDARLPPPAFSMEDSHHNTLQPDPIQPESIRIVDRVSVQESGLCSPNHDAFLLLELLRNIEESPLIPLQIPYKQKQLAGHSDQYRRAKRSHTITNTEDHLSNTAAMVMMDHESSPESDHKSGHSSHALSSFEDDPHHQPSLQRPMQSSCSIDNDVMTGMAEPFMAFQDIPPRPPVLLATQFELPVPKDISSSINTEHRRTNTVQRATIVKSDHDTRWNKRLKDLKRYYLQHRTHVITDTNGANRGLTQWVKRQRYQYRLKVEGKQSPMTESRIAALNELGFCWDPRPSLWDERYEELRAFHKANGHCKIPTKYSANPALAVWVKCQRRQMKLLDRGEYSCMTEERLAKLLSLGFDWNPRNLKPY